MQKTVLVIVALAGAVLGAQPQPLTSEQTLERRGIGALEFSPDHTGLAFTVTEPVKGAARKRNIWLLEVASGRARQLTFAAQSDGSPRWAPDGRSLAFLSDRDGAAKLYQRSMSGGEVGRLTDRQDRIEAFRWSPDGTRIALLMPEPRPEAQQTREAETNDARVAEKGNQLSRVWLLDVGTRALTQVTTATYRIGQIEFAPDGGRLIATAAAKPLEDQFNDASLAIDLAPARPAETPRR